MSDLPLFQMSQAGEPKRSDKFEIASKRDLELLRFSSIQQSPDYTADVGYSPALFSQVSLPYKDPKDQEVWIRRNGEVTLQVTPRTVKNTTTGLFERKYPYGITPRLLVAFLTTEVMKSGGRTVELGGSVSAFMRSLGMQHTGPNATRLRDHMQRFFGSSITFEGRASNNAGEGLKTVYFQFASEMSLWDSAPRNEGDIVHRAPWQNEVVLSEAFSREILARPIPLDLNVLRQLTPSPLKADVYLWLAHRMSWIREDVHISWAALEEQFGAQFKQPRQFKAAFLEAIAAVQKVYPGLNVDTGKGVLILKPSPTPIPKVRSAKRSKMQFSGDKFPEAPLAIES
ncbi:hypothetical protein F1C58_16540 (plasmid) [Glaciihabitans sp. INWT7]|uniref:replication protein RepA n=1 Tax=Glaciihabitans sp. INWT7 TaxID=2596912 RepID=UPI0016273388|nr:replication protein RepA [Glaciihabitans sp. INWT7]QNE48665.1 hypothetical protein F1C58_16540 [Glaciihabitans sp. INWT7]